MTLFKYTFLHLCNVKDTFADFVDHSDYVDFGVD